MAGFVTTINIERLLSKASQTDKAQRQFANRVLHDCNKRVPVRTGALKGSGHLMGNDRVVWDADYAVYVYNMDHVISAGNPRGCPAWFEATKAEELPTWKELAKRLVGSDDVITEEVF